MGRKKKALPIWENVTIEDVAAEGMTLTHIDGRVVFVPFAVPGDVVDLQARRIKSRYAEAEIIRMIHPSSQRVEPFCPHFGSCGGCRWQSLAYADQLYYKQRIVNETLHRIGQIELPDISPILPSQHIRAYRNKLEFSFCNRRWLTRAQMESAITPDDNGGLGFHIPGAFDKVLDITFCGLMDDINNRIRNSVRRYAQTHGLPFYNVRTQQGLLRNLTLRTSKATGEVMVLLQVRMEDNAQKEAINGLLCHIADTFPEVSSLLYTDNHKCNDTIGDLDIVVFKGNPYIIEEMEGLRFKVSPKSFYQTNSEQAYELYKVVRQLAKVSKNDHVYDLYTGTGTIANFLAHDAHSVIGIEYVPEAIDDAKENSLLNGINNTSFYAGDMKNVLNDSFMEAHGYPDVIVTDPPRAGMHPDVISTILRAAPERIVYVSCNPATQARDLTLMNEAYKVITVQPVDMFPHTHHVENVVLLKRRHDSGVPL